MSKKSKFKFDISKWKSKSSDLTLEQAADNGVRTSTNMLNWAAEFTKVIVTITFIIFVFANIFVVIMMCFQQFTYGNSDLSTFITEIHTTFREVIGGYIVKAAMENVSKIGFSVLSDYLDKKYSIKTITTADDDTLDGSDIGYNNFDDPMVGCDDSSDAISDDPTAVTEEESDGDDSQSSSDNNTMNEEDKQ